jgi:hypothetical protein
LPSTWGRDCVYVPMRRSLAMHPSWQRLRMIRCV